MQLDDHAVLIAAVFLSFQFNPLFSQGSRRSIASEHLQLSQRDNETLSHPNIPSLKLTANAPENWPGPKGKHRIPTIHFQVRKC